MADTSKAQKLASARKKYKDLLKEKKKTASKKANEEENISREHTPIDSLTSSTHSSIANDHQNNIQEHIEQNSSPFVDYFNSANSVNFEPPSCTIFQQPATFFDNFSQNLQNDFRNQDDVPYNLNSMASETNNSYFTDVKEQEPQEFNQVDNTNNVSNLNDYFDTNDPGVAEEHPAITPDEIVNIHKDKEHHNLVSEKDTQNLIEYLSGARNVDKHKEDKIDVKSCSDNNENKSTAEVHHSNVESLKQLSEQMAQLIEPDYEYSASTSVTDLEKRNVELAGLLEQERIKTELLNGTLNEYKLRLTSLETEMKESAASKSTYDAQAISRLKDDLQYHIQTVGMLVAEKTELAANLSQYEMIAKEKTADCEELQARLKTSRSLVADLEREINQLKSEKIKNLSAERDSLEAHEKLKTDYQNLKVEKEEVTQDISEVREKLKNITDTNLNLQQQCQDLSNKLSLANIKIQQLTTNESIQVDSQVEQLTQEKFALEKQISNLNQTIKTISKERDEASGQFQQFVQQLNNQMAVLANRVEQLQQENENLVTQEQNRIKHISELERQLQNLQNQHINFSATDSSSSAMKSEIDSTRELCVQLQMEKTELEENFTKVSNEKEILLIELNAKNESISQLESMVEQLRGNQPDSVKLLAVMESDKVAAARAVSQNKELKEQMESMQEVFVKLNNDKVELTEKLTTEHQTNRDLFEKLQKTEELLQTLAGAIEIKDKELTSLRDNSEELNKQVLQQEQLTDRLRHYEAQNHSSHSLQEELQEAKHTITKLANEINQFKLGGVQTEGNINGTDIISEEQDSEVEELRNKLKVLELRNIELESKISKNMDSDSMDRKLSTGDNCNDDLHSLDKEVAMKYLEDKFKRRMQDIAELTEEKQRLEHLVLQLQGETETIGEYVALYQHQRSILKQKALEKDQQLKQLANDREQMKVKLDQLNNLVRKLVVEKGGITPEILSQHAKLCSEHQEMSKTSTDVLLNETADHKSSETAEKIIALLSEIKTSSLVQPSENYHPCAWCSGQLITV